MMDDSYVIGIRLALDNGVSEGVASIRSDLATLDRAIAATNANLQQLATLAMATTSAAGPRLSPTPPPAGKPIPDDLAAPPIVVSPKQGPLPALPSPPERAAATTTLVQPSAERPTPHDSPAKPLSIAPRPLNQPPAQTAHVTRQTSPIAPPALRPEATPNAFGPHVQPTAPSASVGTPPLITAKRSQSLPSNSTASGPSQQPHAPPTQPQRPPASSPIPFDRSPQRALQPLPMAPQLASNPIPPAEVTTAPTQRTPPTKTSTASLQKRPQISLPTPYAPPAPPTPQSPPSAAPRAPPTASGPTSGDVFLDGTRLGTWLASHLNREASRPPAGTTGFDPRLGISWPGTQQ